MRREDGKHVHFQIIGLVTSGVDKPFHLQGQPDVVVENVEAGSTVEAMHLFTQALERSGAEVLAITGVGEWQ
jgi:hypothetical protein